MTDSEKPSTGTPLKFINAAHLAYHWLNDWHNKHLGVFKDKSSDQIPGVDRLIYLLAYHNYSIWHWEDMARCGYVARVVEAKWNIDPHNQKRNDTIEEIDEYYIQHQTGQGPYNSETIGSILDRIIINNLKILHIAEFPDKAAERLPILKTQKRILENCGEDLLTEMRTGKRQIIHYRQLKMYNDAETNTHIGKTDA